MPCTDYLLTPALSFLFKQEPWWVFMGKYFGFPDCCVINFCITEKREYSLFEGTGFVPCPKCNKLLINDLVKREFINNFNSNRFHSDDFAQNSSPADNPLFFEIMEEFYLQNNMLPYEDIISLGGARYLHDKFFDAPFSFEIFLTNKVSKELVKIDIASNLLQYVFDDKFGDILYELTTGRLTLKKQKMLLTVLGLESTHNMDARKTKKNINEYVERTEQIVHTLFQRFRTYDIT